MVGELRARALWLSVAGVVAVLLVGCADQVRLENDLDRDVRLSGCKRELRFVPAGSEISYRPHHPCFVRDAETLEVLGCLRFPPEAFADDPAPVVLLSSMVTGLSERDCVTMEDY